MEKKISKKEIIIIFVGIILLIGSSYAWYILTIKGNNPSVIKSGNLSLILNDENSGEINIDKVIPITDEEGQEYVPYTFTIENNGTIDSAYTIYLDDEELTGQERIDDKYIKYSLTKNNESPKIALLSTTGTSPNRVLDTGKIIPKEKIFYELRIWIDYDATNEAMEKAFKTKLRIEATQAKKLCRRATEETLHKEVCNQEKSSNHYCGSDYAVGDTITYGSTGTSGTLTTGDAFDCDVDGNGTYDDAAERFYYLTDMNTDTAVLVYYNNVSDGVASNSTAYAYDESGLNNNGPATAKLQLPKTTQWRNVSLSSKTRAITNESGGPTTEAGNLPTAFSYEEYATRLLTYQEVKTGCYDGITIINTPGGLSSKCKFLYENTKYSNNSMKTTGFWLETPDSSYSSEAWFVYANGRHVNIRVVSSTDLYGVRPAIEVAKSDILY